MGQSTYPVTAASQAPTLPSLAPANLSLRLTLTSTQSGITYPGNPSVVYVIAAGGGQSGGYNVSSTSFGTDGGGGGAIFTGWVSPSSTVTIGAGGAGGTGNNAIGGDTVYGSVICKGGGNTIGACGNSNTYVGLFYGGAKGDATDRNGRVGTAAGGGLGCGNAALSAGNGGLGFAGGGGGSGADQNGKTGANGGASLLGYTGGVCTLTSNSGGGGGAGIAGNGSANSGIAGGAGGLGGGGGGAGGTFTGSSSGAGGAGAVLVYY